MSRGLADVLSRISPPQRDRTLANMAVMTGPPGEAETRSPDASHPGPGRACPPSGMNRAARQPSGVVMHPHRGRGAVGQQSKYISNSCGCGRRRIGSISCVRL
jgi:hypothetical protein